MECRGFEPLGVCFLIQINLARHTPETPTATILINANNITISILPSIEIFVLILSESLNSNSYEVHNKTARPTIKGNVCIIIIIV